MATQQKELYLTFDDGPVAGPTEFALETLKQYQVKATFFCIGDNIKKYPDLFGRIINDGHTVGNHTFNHLNGWRNSPKNYIDNVLKCQEEMQRQYLNFKIHTVNGKMLFRPPYGCLTFRQIKLLSRFQIIMWDVLSVDYDKNLSEKNCFVKTRDACRPGSIIVFHDSLKAERNMTYVLPKFIQHFLEQGFVFKALGG